MNYRHAFHAGNFADLVKHAIFLRLLRGLTTGAAPLTVIDTHAGAGLYDLAAGEARRTGEGEGGVARLMRDSTSPEVFDDLKAAVMRVNRPGEWRYYPGSPVLAAQALRPRDRYVACELHPDDYAAVKGALPPEHGAAVHLGDGWLYAARIAPAAPAPLLVLVDPPFERGDDYQEAVKLIRRLDDVNTEATVALWAPIKDLATYDAFLGDVEDAVRGRPILAAEARLRGLDDPMRLNGCAMVVVGPTAGLDVPAKAAVDWVADALGEAGGLGRVTLLSGRR